MSRYNNFIYNSEAYLEEEVKQKSLILKAVKEFVKTCVSHGDESIPWEDLSIILIRATDELQNTNDYLKAWQTKEAEVSNET